ncbi:hypothetical protein [Luteococcus sp. OSA5]|uniref:hypothetical protein n=1 Tax=Luteococcus sp. OSA5 TaxID=3401630 RepID=UPI003B429EAF
MADWTDGSEYAPLERPDAFAAPRVAQLPSEEAPEHPAEGKPAVAPQHFAAPEAAPLEDLAPQPPEPARDPLEPFPTSSRADSAWAAAHAAEWQPTMPLADPLSAAPLSSGQPAVVDFPPPSGMPVAPGQPPVPTDQLQQLPPPSGFPVPLPPPDSAGQQPPQSPHAQAPQPPLPPTQVPQTHPPHSSAPAPGRPTNPFDPSHFALGPAPAQPPPPVEAQPPAQAPGQVPQPGEPSQWPAPQQPVQPPRPAPPPVPTRITPGVVVQQTGGVMLAVLAFGALVPGFSYIMLLIASILSRRSQAGAALTQAIFSLVTWAVLIMWVFTVLNGAGWETLSAWSRIACGVMIPVCLAAAWQDLRQRMGR